MSQEKAIYPILHHTPDPGAEEDERQKSSAICASIAVISTVLIAANLPIS
jgi:hypothetical protein